MTHNEIALISLGSRGLRKDMALFQQCSDDAKWINGQRIEVSGGMTL